MNYNHQLSFNKLFGPLVLGLILSACNDSDYTAPPVVVDPPAAMEYEYQVTVSNLTNAQPFSPVAVLLHATGEIWQFGQPASSALEQLAESGDKSSLNAEDFVIANASDDALLMPGMQTSINITTTDVSANFLSLATMLVNTNDAFTGLSKIDLSQLAVDDELDFRVAVYDAGTEANSESIGSIPGPADGGEGFNALRDDVNIVTRHPGIVSMEDGLTNSVLNNQHKFDNPAMSVKIVRVQ